MRYLVLFSACLLAFLLSACLTIEEKITFKKDGSGTYSTTVDMSEMLSNPFFGAAMQEEMEKAGQVVATRLDSTIDVYGQLAAANPQWTAADHQLMKGLRSTMVMDFEAGEGGIYLSYDFQNALELNRIMQLMSEAQKGEESNGLATAGDLLGAASNTFTFSKKKWLRDYSIPSIENPLGEGEEAEMAKMMFSEAKMVFLMEFPSKIKKVKGFETHTIEGNNTVRVEIPFLDALDNTELLNTYLDGEVKY